MPYEPPIFTLELATRLRAQSYIVPDPWPDPTARIVTAPLEGWVYHQPGTLTKKEVAEYVAPDGVTYVKIKHGARPAIVVVSKRTGPLLLRRQDKKPAPWQRERIAATQGEPVPHPVSLGHRTWFTDEIARAVAAAFQTNDVLALSVDTLLDKLDFTCETLDLLFAGVEKPKPEFVVAACATIAAWATIIASRAQNAVITSDDPQGGGKPQPDHLEGKKVAKRRKSRKQK
jgi:hypothetical protein